MNYNKAIIIEQSVSLSLFNLYEILIIMQQLYQFALI